MAHRNSKNDAELSVLLPHWTAAPVKVTISGSSARNGSNLSQGIYVIIADTSCYFRQGDSTVTATTSSHYLPAGQQRLVDVMGVDDQRIAVIQSVAGGSLFIHKLLS